MRRYVLLASLLYLVIANEHARHLYEALLSSYNKVVRPVPNVGDVLMIWFGASLIRIIDVDEKNQVLTTNLWLEIQWTDAKLKWTPELYGGIEKLHIPSEQIWTPDIVLYNNAAGDPEITIFTDALVYFDGTVMWKPPAIYKSFCDIDVTYFPYDEQACYMKFGMWTYTGDYVDMRQLPSDKVILIDPNDPNDPNGKKLEYLEIGMDLSYYYRSGSWDLLNLTSKRFEVIYTSCCGPEKYVDIRYYLRLRRKPLFYTANLIIPCTLISFLTTYVFFLPKHKITFAISILVTLTVFFLVLIDLIPPTSIVVPLFGKYLMFTMIQVSVSIVIGVVSVNFHHRNANTHRMPRWMRVVFIEKLPIYLSMKRPPEDIDDRLRSRNMGQLLKRTFDIQPLSDFDDDGGQESPFLKRRAYEQEQRLVSVDLNAPAETDVQRERRAHLQLFVRIMRNVRFIAQHFRDMEEESRIATDWSFVSMVMDRVCLISFGLINVLGTAFIICTAPSFYDQTAPMDIPEPTKPLGADTLHPDHISY